MRQFIVLDKKFNLNLVVLLMQSLIGVTLVVVAERIGWIQLRGLNRKDVKLWFPISVLLVFVIYTGSKAIVRAASCRLIADPRSDVLLTSASQQHLNVSVYTIFKNLTIILIVRADWVTLSVTHEQWLIRPFSHRHTEKSSGSKGE